MMRFLCLLLLLILLGSCSGAPTDSCKYKGTQGSYDLTPAMVSSDIQGVPDSVPSTTYYFRPCQNTKQCGTGSNSPPPSPSPVCQVSYGANFSCGSLSNYTQGELAVGGFWIYYTNGDSNTQHTARKVNVSCICDKKPPAVPVVPTAGTYESPTQPLLYTLDFHSPYCCPGASHTSSGGSSFDPGWIFVISVVCAIPLYLVVGGIVKRVVYHSEGWDIIPNREFWASSPGLLKDGIMFIVHKIRGTSSYTSF